MSDFKWWQRSNACKLCCLVHLQQLTSNGTKLVSRAWVLYCGMSGRWYCTCTGSEMPGPWQVVSELGHYGPVPDLVSLKDQQYKIHGRKTEIQKFRTCVHSREGREHKQRCISSGVYCTNFDIFIV